MTKRIYILLFVLLMANCQWLTAVTPLTLDSCLQLAQRNNPQLRRSQLAVRRAEEVKAQARTKYFPQVQATAVGYHALHPLLEVGIDDIGNASVRDLLTTLYGNYGSALELDNSLNFLQHGYSVGVTAIQPLFIGGKIVAGNKLADVGVQAAQLQAEIEQRDVLEQVEQAYWLVYGLQQKQALIDDASMLIDTIAMAVDAAVQAGLALPSDAMQVQIRRDEIQRQQLQLNSGLSLARRALALAIGVPADSITIADEQPPLTLSSSHPLILSSLTPESQLLTLQVRAAELQRRMTLADALPQLAVGANYSYSRFQNNLFREPLGSPTGNGALFVTLRVPITAWWETSHQLREQQFAIEQAKLDADYLGAQLDLRTQQAFDALNDAQALLTLQQNALLHAEEAYQQAQINYEAGTITIAELLQQQTLLTQARTALTDADITCRIAQRRYQDLTNNSATKTKL